MPTGKRPENLILERRRQEGLREEAVKITEYNKMMDLKVIKALACIPFNMACTCTVFCVFICLFLSPNAGS